MVTASMRATMSSGVRTCSRIRRWLPSQRPTLRGVFHAQEQAALGVLPGLAQLVFRDAVLELGELGEDGLEGDGGVLGVDGGVDLHGACVSVVGHAAVGFVGEAAFFPEFHEEAAAHALSEDGAEEVIGVALGVLCRDAVEAEADVGLL